jgi:hypothetical protein
MDWGKRRYTGIMRRFGRWRFNGLAALSLALFVATVMLWVRSYWTFQILARYGEQWHCYGESVAGVLAIELYANAPERHVIPLPHWKYISHMRRERPPFNVWEQLHHFEFSGGAGGWTVAFPHWLPCIIFLGTPALWLRRHRQERRQIADGCCRSCGYNLTGNVSGVCPECGKPIEKVVQAKC